MRYAYFPGCSLKSTGRAYAESLERVFADLALELVELKEWDCCGATTVLAVDEVASCILAARNLALAAREGLDVVAPCASCYLVLKKAKDHMAIKPDLRDAVERALKIVHLEYRDNVKVRHPLEVLLNDAGEATIKQHAMRPLAGLKVAPYYGCQLVRPHADFDNADEPTSMDRLLKACGATIVPFASKTRCCGATQTSAMPELCGDLIQVIVEDARRQKADIIATACPLCQLNVELYQPRTVQPIPIVYFTQLMGWAFGATEREVGLHRSLLSAADALMHCEARHA